SPRKIGAVWGPRRSGHRVIGLQRILYILLRSRGRLRSTIIFFHRRRRLGSTILVISTHGWGTHFIVYRRGQTSMGTATCTDIAVFFCRGDLLVFCFGILHAARDDDLHADFFIDGSHVVIAIAVMENADYGFLLALHDADDPAFSPAIVADTAHLHQHLITVHGVADFWRRNKDIALQLALGTGGQRPWFWDDEAVAIAVHPQAANDQVLIGGGGRQAPTLFADGDELATVSHLAEKLLEMAAVTA